MSSILSDHHYSSPHIVITIVIVVLLVFLNETNQTVESSFFDCKFSKGKSVLRLLDDTSQRIKVVSDAEQAGIPELSSEVAHINQKISVLVEVHQLHSEVEGEEGAGCDGSVLTNRVAV